MGCGTEFENQFSVLGFPHQQCFPGKTRTLRPVCSFISNNFNYDGDDEDAINAAERIGTRRRTMMGNMRQGISFAACATNATKPTGMPFRGVLRNVCSFANRFPPLIFSIESHPPRDGQGVARITISYEYVNVGVHHHHGAHRPMDAILGSGKKSEPSFFPEFVSYAAMLR